MVGVALASDSTWYVTPVIKKNGPITKYVLKNVLLAIPLYSLTTNPLVFINCTNTLLTMIV